MTNMKNGETPKKASKKAKPAANRSIKRPIRSMKEQEGSEIPPEQLETEKEKIETKGLRLSWIRFIDELIANGGDQPAAYMKAYPDVKDERVASACATRLLKNDNVKEELNNKLSSQRATEDYIVERLMGLVELHFVGKGAIVSVKALEILAKMKGLLVDTKKIAFTGDNPAVFPPLYSKEEKEAMDKAFTPTDGKVPVRIVE